MADKIVQIKQKNGEVNDNIIPQKALTSDYPTGFTARRGGEIEWGVQTGTLISCWDVVTDEIGGLGSIAFRKDCPENSKVSMLIDGTVYVNEGQDRVVAPQVLYDSDGVSNIYSIDIPQEIYENFNINDKIEVYYEIKINISNGTEVIGNINHTDCNVGIIHKNHVLVPSFDARKTYFNIAGTGSSTEHIHQIILGSINISSVYDSFYSTYKIEATEKEFIGVGYNTSNSSIISIFEYPISDIHINILKVLYYKGN